MLFSIFTDLCTHHHDSFENIFNKENPVAISSHSPFFPTHPDLGNHGSISCLWICLLGTIYINGIIQDNLLWLVVFIWDNVFMLSCISSVFHSFLWPNTIPSHGDITFCFSGVGHWVDSTFFG